MFKWLTNLVTGQKRKETEINRLKQQIDQGVAQCKQKAALGDQDATLKLRAFEDTISEQSIRLLRESAKPNPKPAK